jgi:hypothetical protein
MAAPAAAVVLSQCANSKSIFGFSLAAFASGLCWHTMMYRSMIRSLILHYLTISHFAIEFIHTFFLLHPWYKICPTFKCDNHFTIFTP